MDKNPFKRISTEVKYENPWIKVREDKVIRPGGKEGIFGVIEMQSGVTVVPLDRQGNVYLTQEFKYAREAVLLECMSGGFNEKEENPLEGAKRELKEEIGAVSEEWVSLGTTTPMTSIIKTECHLFLAKNVEITNLQDTDEGEVIGIVSLPFSEAIEKAMSGEILHAPSVVALLRAHILLKT